MGSSGQVFEPTQVISDLDSLLSSPLLIALLSQLARTERPADPSEFQKQKDIMVLKEIKASQSGDLPEALHYSCLFTDAKHEKMSEHCPNSSYMLAQLWGSGMANFTSKLSQTTIFYPHYNTDKNVSHWTSDALNQEEGQDLTDRSRTTWDLLAHYFRTGVCIQGPCEMRVSWKLNDLKPRVYYCLGGTAYFDSLWIKGVCNLVQKILPCTNPDLRFDINRLTISVLDRDEFLITYDYSSFTTNLAELKYFMSKLGLFLRGTTFYVLDVREGIRELDLGEYILMYNASINVCADFSIHRVTQEDDGDHYTASLSQTRNGMLGVGGNIGFSTTLHGISLSAFTDRPDRDSCVGDDALTRILKLYFANFVAHSNLLGVLNPEKYATLSVDPYNMDVSEQTAYRYLKRPLRVDYLGTVQQGRLEVLPSFAEVLNFIDPDKDRDCQDVSADDLAITFAMQTRRFYQNLERYEISYSDDEMIFILSMLRKCYTILGMPIGGALPGALVKSNRRTGFEGKIWNMVIPPVRDEVLNLHWTDLLIRDYLGQTCLVPRTTSDTILLPFQGVGDEVVMTSNPALEILVNLGYLDRRVENEVRRVGEDFRADDIRTLIDLKGNMLYSYTQTLPDLPLWYNDLVLFYDNRLNIV